MSPVQWRTIPPLPGKPVGKKRKLTRVRWLLLLFLIVLLIVLFLRSSISKVREVHWSGNRLLVSQAELSRSGIIKPGDSYFTADEHEYAQQIQSKFPALKSVQVNKQFFPGVIKIYAQEYVVIAYELTKDGSTLACLENGLVIQAGNKQQKLVPKKPILTQWHGQNKLKAKLSKVLATAPEGLLVDISEIRHYPSPPYPDRIKMYTRSGFEVITTVPLLLDNIAYLRSMVEFQPPGRITMLEANSYMSYEDLSLGIERVKGEQTKTNKTIDNELYQ